MRHRGCGVRRRGCRLATLEPAEGRILGVLEIPLRGQDCECGHARARRRPAACRLPGRSHNVGPTRNKRRGTPCLSVPYLLRVRILLAASRLHKNQSTAITPRTGSCMAGAFCDDGLPTRFSSTPDSMAYRAKTTSTSTKYTWKSTASSLRGCTHCRPTWRGRRQSPRRVLGRTNGRGRGYTH